METEDQPAQHPAAKEAAEAKTEEPEKDVIERENRALKREEYDRHINLFKFYCNIALKANLYFYLITGGITSFYFNTLSRINFNTLSQINNPDSTPDAQLSTILSSLKYIEVSFLLPIFMSGVLGGVFLYGRLLWLEIVETIEEIREDLNKRGLLIKKTPEVGLLASLLLIFGGLFFLVGIALIVLMAVQMKNNPAKVWTTNQSWRGTGGLLHTPQFYLILTPAVLILIAGILLPRWASGINWNIKRLRIWKRRRLIEKLFTELEQESAKLQNPKLNKRDCRFKDSLLYYKLRPHLSEKTVKMINKRKFDKALPLIMRDLTKLEIKWELIEPYEASKKRRTRMSQSPATNLRKKLAGISLIAAPVMLLLADLTNFISGLHYPRYLIAKTAFAVFIAATLGLVHLLRERADRMGLIGGGLTIVGCISGATIVTFGLLEQTAIAVRLDAATLQSIERATEQIWMAVVMFPLPGLFFPIGLLVLSVGLYRTKLVARLIAVVLALGAVLFPIGRIPGILPFELASDILLVVALGLIGWRILNWTVAQWESVHVVEKSQPNRIVSQTDSAL